MTLSTREHPPLSTRPELRVDLDVVVANWRALGRLGRAAEVGAVLKADGYGVGAVPIARALLAAGCQTFFVATGAEAERLVAGLDPSARNTRVFVLHGVTECPTGRDTDAPIRPILNDIDEARVWIERARSLGQPLPCGLHIDTGMNRLGFSMRAARDLVDDPASAGLGVEILMSHLACADAPEHAANARQTARFLEALSILKPRWPDAQSSLDNSAGLHLGGRPLFDLGRPGIALLGANPIYPSPSPIRTALTLTAPLLQVRDAEPEDCVGYGADHVIWRPRRLGIAGIGYADGVLRSSASGGYAILHGVRTPIVGRVSMDLLTLDVSNAVPLAQPGDRLELFGSARAIEAAAADAGAIPYELLTGLGPRVERVYRGHAANGEH